MAQTTSDVTPNPSAGRSPGHEAAAISAIETRSIDWVPETERHGKRWQQGPFWFLGNFQPFTVAIGFLGPSLGLSLSWTIVASVIGVIFGTLFMALHATQGPRLGLPQMIQSRAQFGYRGVVVVLAATVFTYVGFNVLDTVIIDSGLHGIFGWNTTLVGLVIAALATLLAIYGHDWLHHAFRLLFWVSIPFWAILTVAIFVGHAGGHAPAHGGTFLLVPFLVQLTVCASYNITYAPYVSDYTRYLPANTRPGGLINWVMAGAAGSPIWLIPIGAWMGSRLGVADPLVGIHTAGNHVFGGLGSILTILSVLALVATMGLNAYGGMLSLVTGADSVRKIQPTRQLRIIGILAVAIIWTVLGVGIIHNLGNSLNNTLLLLLYVLAPWTAVNLADYFFVRKGHYAITDIFKPGGLYGNWAWRGILCYLVGLAVEAPFVNLTFYESPGAKALSGVDISFLIAMAISAVLYVVLTKLTLNVASEQAAIAASEAELATIAAAE